MKGRKLVFAGEDMCTLPGKQHILRHCTVRNQFVQKSSSSRLTMCPVPSTPLHAVIARPQIFSLFKCLKVCKIYTYRNTLICQRRNLINDFCYKRSINKAENEHKMDFGENHCLFTHILMWHLSVP